MNKKKIKGLLFIFVPLLSISTVLILMGNWKPILFVWVFALTIYSIAYGFNILWDIKHKND